LLIFRKAAAGELAEDSGLADLYRNVSEIDVDKEGVKGAKNFFTAKVGFLYHNDAMLVYLICFTLFALKAQKHVYSYGGFYMHWFISCVFLQIASRQIIKQTVC